MHTCPVPISYTRASILPSYLGCVKASKASVRSESEQRRRVSKDAIFQSERYFQRLPKWGKLVASSSSPGLPSIPTNLLWCRHIRDILNIKTPVLGGSNSSLSTQLPKSLKSETIFLALLSHVIFVTSQILRYAKSCCSVGPSAPPCWASCFFCPRQRPFV